jgi:hypothetical protein
LPQCPQYSGLADPSPITNLRQSEALRAASALQCEACAAAVPPILPRTVPYPTRNHCPPCAARLEKLDVSYGGSDSERALWIQAAGTWLPEWCEWGQGAG